jgi:hypothetical protein
MNPPLLAGQALIPRTRFEFFPTVSTIERGSVNGSPLGLFRTSPDFWMNAQKAVDLYEAAGHVQSLPRPLLKAS